MIKQPEPRQSESANSRLAALKPWLAGYNVSNSGTTRCLEVYLLHPLRFELHHGAYDFYVRVVNMSFGYPSYVRNLPWPDLSQGDFKTNLYRDLKKNDSLYVASAGN